MARQLIEIAGADQVLPVILMSSRVEAEQHTEQSLLHLFVTQLEGIARGIFHRTEIPDPSSSSTTTNTASSSSNSNNNSSSTISLRTPRRAILEARAEDGSLERMWAHALRVGQLAHVVGPAISVSDFKYFVSIMKSHLDLQAQYKPKLWADIPVLVIRTKHEHDGDDQEEEEQEEQQQQQQQEEEEDDDDETMGWKELTSQEINVIYSPGSHLTMIYEPNVNSLAGHLEKFFGRIGV